MNIYVVCTTITGLDIIDLLKKKLRFKELLD